MAGYFAIMAGYFAIMAGYGMARGEMGEMIP
jgi:hypothetical protein